MQLSANCQLMKSNSLFSEKYTAQSLAVAEVCVAFAAWNGGEANALINLVLPTGFEPVLPP